MGDSLCPQQQYTGMYHMDSELEFQWERGVLMETGQGRQPAGWLFCGAEGEAWLGPPRIWGPAHADQSHSGTGEQRAVTKGLS